MSAFSPKTGLLLINLGTPDSTAVRDVRRYLREFLSDPRVIDIPALPRWLILNLFILPRRPRQSAEAYAKIWSPQGSPLLVYSQELAAKVQARLGNTVQVELAMRYGNPSLTSALDRLQQAGVDRIVAMPLYPQYSSAATGSSVEALFRAAGERWDTPFIHIVPPFFDHHAFIEAFAQAVRPTIEAADPQRVIFSYHGLPERHCRKSDSSGSHCLAKADCCERLERVNRNCYRAQCVATTRSLGDALGIPPEQRVLCFQSRLGKDPWIRPYTDQLLNELPAQGVQRAVVLTPAFVADCLETLEEIGMRGAEAWSAAGGNSLTLAPCPNSSDAWADAVITIAKDSSRWL